MYCRCIRAFSESLGVKGRIFMKICEKIMLDNRGLCEYGPINIVIFGDSVSHGVVNGYNDYEHVYWNRLRQKMNRFRDYIPINMINSAIEGTTAAASVERLERDVLTHHPDLVIVCFGLNDVNGVLGVYLDALTEIFRTCTAAGCDVIFMTPNMLNTYVAEDVPKQFYDYAHKTAVMQNDGTMDRYMSSAVSLAKEMGITVCDCYTAWKELAEKQDTTLLLANRINHPIPEMHQLFADRLYEIIMAETNSNDKETV